MRQEHFKIKNPLDLLTKARAGLLVNEPFYGSLAMKLEPSESRSIPAMSVDGRYQFYNPDWVLQQSVGKLKFVLAHEVTHLVFSHHTRRAGRDRFIWNQACDFVVNAELKAGGWVLPRDCLHNPVFDGMSAEQIYASLMNETQPGGDPEGRNKDAGQPGNTASPGKGGMGAQRQRGEEQTGGAKGRASPQQQNTGQQLHGQASDGTQGSQTPSEPEPGQVGMVMDPVDEKDYEAGEDAWNQAVVAAAKQAEKAGKLPGNVARRVQDLLKPAQPWQELLRGHFRGIARDELSYSRFNRKYIDQEMYLPSMHSEAMGPLAIAIDTSGSIDAQALSAFVLEMEAILQEVSCSEVHMMACDTKIQGEVATSYDKQLPNLALQGGGGTRFRPVFEEVEKLGLNPDLLVYFTDLECREVEALEDPGYPIVWAKWGAAVWASEPNVGVVVQID